MTLEELTKQFEDYKKVQDEKSKKQDEDYKKEIEDLKKSHKEELDDLKKKKLEYELNTGCDVQKEEIPEEDKIVSWKDISKDIGKCLD